MGLVMEFSEEDPLGKLDMSMKSLRKTLYGSIFLNRLYESLQGQISAPCQSQLVRFFSGTRSTTSSRTSARTRA